MLSMRGVRVLLWSLQTPPKAEKIRKQGGIIHGIRIRIAYYTYFICSYSCCPLLRHRVRRLTLATRSSSRTTTRPSHAGRGAGRRVSTRRSRRSPSCSRCANVFKHTFIRAPRSASAVAHTPDVGWSSGTRMLYACIRYYTCIGGNSQY